MLIILSFLLMSGIIFKGNGVTHFRIISKYLIFQVVSFA
ncbi:hypothetical protein HPHPH28_1574 [Helicobacter pylori Hp H-28]|nr:hypothetical protein HPHPH28_1574 [Helicobacter pylori Hp H-28]